MLPAVQFLTQPKGVNSTYWANQSCRVYENYKPCDERFITQIVLQSFEILSKAFNTESSTDFPTEFARAANTVISARQSKLVVPQGQKINEAIATQLFDCDLNHIIQDPLCYAAYMRLSVSFLGHKMDVGLNSLSQILTTSSPGLKPEQFERIAKIAVIAFCSYPVLPPPLKRRVENLDKHFRGEVIWIKFSDLQEHYEILKANYLELFNTRIELFELPKSRITMELDKLYDPDRKASWENGWELVDIVNEKAIIEGEEWEVI